MVSVRTGDYIVESIGKGKKRGSIKVFRKLKNAKKYARAEYAKGRGVAIDLILKCGQKPLVEKGMGRTAIQKKDSNFGKL